MKEENRNIPAVALRGMTILPGMVAHFDVSRSRSVRAVEAAMMKDQTVFLVTQRNVEKEEPELEDLYGIGIIAVIKQVIKLQNNVVRVLVEGETRARLKEMEWGEYLVAEAEPLQREEEMLTFSFTLVWNSVLIWIILISFRRIIINVSYRSCMVCASRIFCFSSNPTERLFPI